MYHIMGCVGSSRTTDELNFEGYFHTVEVSINEALFNLESLIFCRSGVL